MRIFLDTSVLLAACRSKFGASRAIVEMASDQGWKLIASPWVKIEVEKNLAKFPFETTAAWVGIRSKISLVDDVLSIDRALVFPAGKDRPVLITALAWADVLLTLDSVDFIKVLGSACYGLPILLPAEFLVGERNHGRLL
ncbi:MAG: PIN domain-containing protein [Verrucomicrobiota bacterium]